MRTRSGHRERQRTERAFPSAQRRWEVERERSAAEGRRLPAADRRVSQRRAGRSRTSATSDDSVEDLRDAGYANGKPAMMVISSASRARTSSTPSTRRASAAALTSVDSPAHRLAVAMDQTTTIRASVRDVERTLLISIGLVILVVFLFLRSLAHHAIPERRGAALADRHLRRHVSARLQPRQPLADGADISTGFVVDDAIVVIENITRHIEQGMSRWMPRSRARAKSASPCVDQHLAGRGLHSASADGRHRRPAVPRVRGHDGRGDLISMVISLTATPMMCATLLKPHEGASRPGVRGSERGFRWSLARYGRRAPRVLRFAADAAGADRDHRPDRRISRPCAEGIFPAAGHRTARGPISRTRTARRRR